MQDDRHMHEPEEELASLLAPADPRIQQAVHKQAEHLLDEWTMVDSRDCSPGVSASQQNRLSRVPSKKEACEEEEQHDLSKEEAATAEEEPAEESDEPEQEQAAQEDLSPRSDSAAADQVLGRPFSTPVTTPITTPRKQGSTWSLWTMENASKDAAMCKAQDTPTTLLARLASASASSANRAWSGITAWLGPPVFAAHDAWCTALGEFSCNLTQLALLIRDDIGEAAASMRQVLGSAHQAAGRAMAPMQAMAAQTPTSIRFACIRLRKMAGFLNHPMSPCVAVSLGALTTVSCVAAAALAFSNRSLFQQLQKRDRDLAQLVLSIVELSQAMKSQAGQGPTLRHVSASTWPSFRPFYAAGLV